MAMATGRGTVKLMDMRSSWQVRVVELTPDQWRAVWWKIEQALAVAEGRHLSQAPQTPGGGHPPALASSADASGAQSRLRASPDGGADGAAD